MSAEDNIFEIHNAPGRLVAAAIHNGHDVREEIREHLALSDDERLREEDPFTSKWTHVAETRIVGLRSRFEVDLNRPRDQAVYRTPKDAWGLEVWKESITSEIIDRSLAEYDAFYDAVQRLFEEKAQQGPFVVYDLHSYNHRRGGPDHPPDDPELNPEINVGTGSMDRERWAPVVNRIIEVLRSIEIDGRRLDVRENVKFTGGHFVQWAHSSFPDTACAMAIEFKKTFMDEWTGEPQHDRIAEIRAALEETVDPVLDALKKCS